MQKYEWKCPGLYKVGADIAAKVVESCKDSSGYIQPTAVVDKSRPAEAELHGCFEWQDNIAADRWREQQARVLIKNIVTVEIRDDDKKQDVIKTFVHVISPEEQSRGYKMTAVAVQDPRDRDYILSTARRELASFKSKYSKLTEFAALMNTIDEVIASLDGEKDGG